jgi:hypothetical protein
VQEIIANQSLDNVAEDRNFAYLQNSQVPPMVWTFEAVQRLAFQLVQYVIYFHGEPVSYYHQNHSPMLR